MSDLDVSAVPENIVEHWKSADKEMLTRGLVAIQKEIDQGLLQGEAYEQEKALMTALLNGMTQ